MAAKKEPVVEKAAATFTKEQLYNSKRYADRKDILMVVLDENKEYTFEEVNELVENFLNRKVN